MFKLNKIYLSFVFILFSLAIISCKNNNQMKKTASINKPIIINNNNSSKEIISNPIIKNIYSISQDIIAVQIDAQKVEYGNQISYKKENGDKKVLFWNNPIYNGQIKRNGYILGTIIGKNKDIIKLYDKIIGNPLDINSCRILKNYIIQSDDDKIFNKGQIPAQIFLKCKPTNIAWLGEWYFDYTTTNIIYLKLNNKMKNGSVYNIIFKNINVNQNKISYKYDPYFKWNESVHLSQIGFKTDDPVKKGYLSIWLGTGGSYSFAKNLSFSIINNITNKIVYTGKIKTAKKNEDIEAGRFCKNYNKTNVYTADFSSLNQPGEYRLYIEGIGCSKPFLIENNIWEEAFKTAARGFYHQRNGIQITSPFSTYNRPRSMHPDDGYHVFQSDYSFMDLMIDVQITHKFSFEKIRKKSSKIEVKNAWGGYMDAGDWDRNINHLESTFNFFELYCLYPDFFQKINLNIPESNNKYPDIIDEAIWNLDFYHRLQLPNGSVRGGIESAEHPQYGEASWQESLDLYAFAPDVWSTYFYAAAAARCAFVMLHIDPEFSIKYKISALKAMEWAENELLILDNNIKNKFTNQINEKRNLAALELYRLTGNKKWHSIFKETTAYNNSNSLFNYQSDQSKAAFLYTQIKNRELDKNILNNINMAFLKHADSVMNIIDETAFNFYYGKRDFIGWGSVTAINTQNLLRAYFLTHDKKYLKYSILSAQFSLGANPLNLCFTTGLGYNYPMNPLITDMRMMGTAPPPGITLYGPIDFDNFHDIVKYFLTIPEEKCIPEPREWPNTESYFDIYWAADMCEFTIAEQMSPVTWIFGFLAACKR